MLGDQALVSCGNFATGLILARYLPPAQYGLWALLLETMLFFNSLQAALVIYPLTIHGATPDRISLRRLASVAMLFTLLLAPILAAGMMVAASAASVAAVAAVAMVAWQLQETLRRGLIAQMRLADCLWGDAISYLGQAVGVYLLHRLGLLTLHTAFVVVGVTSVLAMGVQAAQVGFARFSLADLASLAASHWRLGRWALLANLTRLITSLLLLWSLQRWHGATAMAEFAALVMLLKITNPVGAGLGGLITPAVAGPRRDGDFHKATRAGLYYTVFGTLLLIPYYVPLCVFPTQVLRIVFGADSPYLRQASLLWVVVLYFYMNYLAAVLSAWLMGLSESRANFLAQLVQVAAVLGLAWPLTLWRGVEGVMYGGVISTGAAAAMTAYYIVRTTRAASDRPISSAVRHRPDNPFMEDGSEWLVSSPNS